MKKTIAILIFSFLFCTINAQTKATKKPFYSYYLWYNGTIGKQPIKAKLVLKNGQFKISYAHNNDKKWIHLTDTTLKNKTLSGNTTTKTNYTNGCIQLQLDNLWKLTGYWTSKSGVKLPVILKVALNKLPQTIKKNTKHNEFLPLLLAPDKIADSIQVYYSEKLKKGKKSTLKIRTYKKNHPDAYNQIIYVDANFDGYLDLKISDALYLFNIQKQRFEVENSYGDVFPCGDFNIYEKTFSTSHWRTINWYKVINGNITPYETEAYMEYEGGNYLHNIDVSENRIRTINGVEKYSKLDLSLKKETTLKPNEIVNAFIGDQKKGIVEQAQLILRYPSGKSHFYVYEKELWKLQSITVDGEKMYPFKKYYADGKLELMGFYNHKNPKLRSKTGKWTSYYNTGIIHSISHYKKNYIQGKQVNYYKDGQISLSANYTSKGKKNGLWKWYFKNGDLKQIGTYKNEQKIGEWKIYYTKGQYHIQNYDDNGKKTGEWKYYRKDKLHQIEHYKDGKADGVSKSFFDNGKPIYLQYYSRGKAIGTHQLYYKSGQIKKTTTYLDTGISKSINYYKNGSISATKLYKKNKVLAKSFYKNGGALGSIGYRTNKNVFDNQEKNIGKWKYYHQNGKLHYKGYFLEGKRVGKWKGYHPNGKRKFKGKYIDDTKIGIWKFYKNNGKLAKTEHWENGKIINLVDKKK